MKSKLHALLSNPFVLLLVLMAIVFGLDQLLMQFHAYYAANRPLYNPGLPIEAAPNALWYELWFCETIAVILFPFILHLLRGKLQIKARLLPWSVAAIVMYIGAFSVGLNIYNNIKDHGYISEEHDYISIIVHSGAFYQPLDDQYDPSLQSMLPTILKGQILVAGGYAVSALGLSFYESKKIKKRQKS